MALELNGTTGVSLVQDGVVTAADLASGAITSAALPAGNVLQVVHQFASQFSTTVNNTTYFGGASVSLTRKSGTSKFLIIVSAQVIRLSTSGTHWHGYEIGTAGVVSQERYVTDQTSAGANTSLFENTTTGSVGDSLSFRTTCRNSHTQNDTFRYPSITVMEIAQ